MKFRQAFGRTITEHLHDYTQKKAWGFLAQTSICFDSAVG